MLKDNDRDTRTPFSNISIVDFTLVNACWEMTQQEVLEGYL